MTNKWIIRFMEMSRLIASWSFDPSTKVGAVIVNPETKTVVSEGYNGFPRGIPDIPKNYEDRTTKYSLIIHAEVNAILNALYNGRSVRGCAIFVHGCPVCQECAKLIIQSGITTVFYDSEPKEQWKESAANAIKIMEQAGLKVRKI